MAIAISDPPAAKSMHIKDLLQFLSQASKMGNFSPYGHRMEPTTLTYGNFHLSLKVNERLHHFWFWLLEFLLYEGSCDVCYPTEGHAMAFTDYTIVRLIFEACEFVLVRWENKLLQSRRQFTSGRITT